MQTYYSVSAMENKYLNLRNVEIFEYCIFDRLSGISSFDKQRLDNLDGLYFKQNNTFFAIYWYNGNPTIYYEGKEYTLNRTLKMELNKENEKRRFKISDYNIEIEYNASPYINMDSWSSELDVDIFCKIIESYQTNEFYENKPQKEFKFPWTKD